MIRILLHDQGVEYTEDLVAMGSEAWTERKRAGIADGTYPFGQMPRFVDEDGTAVVQSQSIPGSGSAGAS